MTRNMSNELISKHRTAIMGLSIIWIMLYHFRGHEADTYLQSLLATGMGGVDFFFFLSGYGLTYSYFDRLLQTVSAFGFYKKRLHRILPAYFSVIIICNAASGGSIAETLWSLSCISFWIRKPYYDWYIPSLLLFYAVFPLFIELARKTSIKKSSALFIAVGLVFTAILVAMWKGDTYMLFFSRIPVFFVGCMWGYMLLKGKRLSSTCKWAVVVLSLAAIAAECWLTVRFDSVFLNKISLGHLLFTAICPGACLVLSGVFEYLGSNRLLGVVNTVLCFIGSISLEVYLCHLSLVKEPMYVYLPLAVLCGYVLNRVIRVVERRLAVG